MVKYQYNNKGYNYENVFKSESEYLKLYADVHY